MTVIAWDGKTLCADKRGVSNGWYFSLTKIFRIDKGLVGIDGNYDVGLELIEWLKEGADPKTYPEIQKDNERYAHMVLITAENVILQYARRPYAIRLEEKFFASGAGRDFALAALSMGKTSREAVEIACQLDNSCGNGIDELAL